MEETFEASIGPRSRHAIVNIHFAVSDGVVHNAWMKATLVIAMVVAAWPSTLAAQQPPGPASLCPEQRPPYRFLRMDEEYDFLRNAECRSEELDALKFITLGEGSQAFLSLGGDLRIKLANGRDVIFGDDPGDPINVISTRLHAHANLRFTRHFRLFGELKYNDVYRREPQPLPVDVDRMDLHQAFAELETGAASARLGRQELVYGSGRRIFPRNGPNVRGSFDAARVRVKAGATIDLFAFRPVEVDRNQFDDGPVRTQSYAGAYASLAAPGTAVGKADLYFINAERDGVRFNQGAGDESRQSLGARLEGRAGAWDWDHEITWQWGRFAGGDIRAWSIALDARYSLPAAANKPRIGLRLDAASGDKDPASSKLETFNALLPRGGVVSESFNFSPANLLHVRPSINFDPGKGLRYSFGADAFWRQSDRDGVYGPPGNLIRPAGISRARYVGADVDARVVYAASRNVTLECLGGYFAPGTFLKESGAPKRQVFVSAYLFVRF